MGKLSFRNINKVYPNGFHAVHDFNLDVDDGEFIVLVGPSGCGKSTILRMLGGLEQITGGELYLDERLINKCPPVERDIAIVFQDYALYGNMSVYDNVGISMTVRHEQKTDILDKVLEASKVAEIEPYLKRLPKQLSGGQKQRVALARAIIRNPRVFLMDEPLSNLDAKLRNSTRLEIVKLQRKLGVTTIYVTHDQTEAMTMADRMVVMKEGFVQQIGTPVEIYNAPANTFVAGFIGVPQMNFIEGGLHNGCFVFGGNRIKLPADDAKKLTNFEGKELILGLRPEAIDFSNDALAGSFRVTVESEEYLGSYRIVHTVLGKQKLDIQTDDTTTVLNQEIYLLPNPCHAHYFDKNTTNAVLHTRVGGSNA